MKSIHSQVWKAVFFTFLLLANLTLMVLAETGAPLDDGTLPSDAIPGDNHFFSDKWDIETGDTIIRADQTITLNGDLWVLKGASLTLDNVTLIFNTTNPGSIGIEILEESIFVMRNCTISAVNEAYSFVIKNNAVVDIADTSISNVLTEDGIYNKGIKVFSDKAKFTRCAIGDSMYGFNIEGGDPHISHTLFNDTETAIVINQAGAPTIDNCTFHNSTIGIHFKSNGGTGRPMIDNCTVYDLPEGFNITSSIPVIKNSRAYGSNVSVFVNENKGIVSNRANLINFRATNCTVGVKGKNSPVELTGFTTRLMKDNSSGIVSENSDFYLSGSVIKECNESIQAKDSYISLEKSQITGQNISLNLSQSTTLDITNGTLVHVGEGKAIIENDCTANFLNSSVDMENIILNTTGKVNSGNFLCAQAKKKSGDPFPGILINITDHQGTILDRFHTDDNGMVSFYRIIGLEVTKDLGTGGLKYDYSMNDHTFRMSYRSQEFLHFFNGTEAQSYSHTINVEPFLFNVSLEPREPRTNHSLRAIYEWEDPDPLDSEQGTTIRWFKNNQYVPAHDDEMEVGWENTSRGDWWNFTITPSDGGEFGEPVKVNQVKIINTAPKMSQTGDITVMESFSFEHNFTAFDPDNDTIKYQLISEAASIEFNDTSGNFKYSPGEQDVGDWDIQIKSLDGAGGVDWCNFSITTLPLLDHGELIVKVIDHLGSPLADVNVSLFTGSIFTMNGFTLDGGVMNLSKVNVDNYDVFVFKEGYYVKTQRIEVRGARLTQLEIALDPIVQFDLELDVVSTKNVGLNNTTVQVTATDLTPNNFTLPDFNEEANLMGVFYGRTIVQTADMNGSVSVPSLPVGNYTLKITRDGYEPITYFLSINGSLNLSVPIALNMTLYRINERFTGFLYGNITTNKGKAIKNAKIYIGDKIENATLVYSDENGSFFSPILQGEYKVFVFHDNKAYHEFVFEGLSIVPMQVNYVNLTMKYQKARPDNSFDSLAVGLLLFFLTIFFLMFVALFVVSFYREPVEEEEEKEEEKEKEDEEGDEKEDTIAWTAFAVAGEGDEGGGRYATQPEDFNYFSYSDSEEMVEEYGLEFSDAENENGEADGDVFDVDAWDQEADVSPDTEDAPKPKRAVTMPLTDSGSGESSRVRSKSRRERRRRRRGSEEEEEIAGEEQAPGGVDWGGDGEDQSDEVEFEVEEDEASSDEKVQFEIMDEDDDEDMDVDFSGDDVELLDDE